MIGRVEFPGLSLCVCVSVCKEGRDASSGWPAGWMTQKEETARSDICVCDDLVCACCARVKCRICFKTRGDRPSKSTHISYRKPKNIMLFQQNKPVGPFSIINSTWAHTQYNRRVNQQQQAVFIPRCEPNLFSCPFETFGFESSCPQTWKRLTRKQMKIHHWTVYCFLLKQNVLPVLLSCDHRWQPWLLHDTLETSRGAVGGGLTKDSAQRLYHGGKNNMALQCLLPSSQRMWGIKSLAGDVWLTPSYSLNTSVGRMCSDRLLSKSVNICVCC